MKHTLLLRAGGLTLLVFLLPLTVGIMIANRPVMMLDQLKINSGREYSPVPEGRTFNPWTESYDERQRVIFFDQGALKSAEISH